ncbi:Calcium-dependent lipid-binding (CaLB domain) family protein [Raphanus sativus]|nr:Calcium-dependent lipid-binding (CaLB domain) family protein [Raphanus sativus]
MKPVTYPVKFIGETKPNGKLSLSYRFKPAPVNDLYPIPPEPVYLPPFVQPRLHKPRSSKIGPACYIYPSVSDSNHRDRACDRARDQIRHNIRNVNVFDDMDVYASVMICEGKTTKHKTKTPIAYSGFKFPAWNHPVKFSLGEEKLAREDRFSLVVELMSHRPVMGDKHIGNVSVQIQELIGSNPPSPSTDVNINDMKLVTRKVGGVYGEGTLSLTYRFLEKQVTIPIVPGTAPQPFIMYVPVPHHPYGSANPVHGASG